MICHKYFSIKVYGWIYNTPGWNGQQFQDECGWSHHHWKMRPSFFEELSIVEFKCDAFEILMWVNRPKQMQHNSQKFSKTERPRATEEMFSFGCGYSGLLHVLSV